MNDIAVQCMLASHTQFEQDMKCSVIRKGIPNQSLFVGGIQGVA